MKSLVAAIVMIFAGASTASAQSVDIKQINEQIYGPSVKIDTGGGSGSGTILYSGPDYAFSAKRVADGATYVLTNYHVVADTFTFEEVWDEKSNTMVKKRVQGRIKVIFYNYYDTSKFQSTTEFYANVVMSNSGRDLALLKIENRGAPAFKSALVAPKDSRLDQGEEVLTMGAGLGATPFMGPSGRIAFNEYQIEGQFYTMYTAASIFGNSGGGAYRHGDQGWELIGVPTRVINMAWHMGFLVPFKDIYTFLETNPSSYENYAWILDPTKRTPTKPAATDSNTSGPSWLTPNTK